MRFVLPRARGIDVSYTTVPLRCTLFTPIHRSPNGLVARSCRHKERGQRPDEVIELTSGFVCKLCTLRMLAPMAEHLVVKNATTTSRGFALR